jgi:hypothetical protein
MLTVFQGPIHVPDKLRLPRADIGTLTEHIDMLEPEGLRIKLSQVSYSDTRSFVMKKRADLQ